MARVESLTADQIRAEIAALLASPALTGTPTAPTPSNGDNDQSIATTAFVMNALATASADNQFWIGSGGPGSGLGTDGDIYMDKANGRFYTKIAGLGWGTETTFLEDLNNAALKNSLLTAKGDIIARGASGPLRRSVGANGEVLIADSAQVTGMRWGSPPSGDNLGRMLPPAGGLFGTEQYRDLTLNSGQFGTTFAGVNMILIPKTITIDALYIHVFTADAAATVGLSLWSCDDGVTIIPATKKASGTFVPSATGLAGVTFAPVTLQPGWVIAGMAASKNDILRVYALNHNTNMSTGVNDIPATARRFQLVSAGAYNAPVTNATSLEGSGADNTAWVGLRRAS